jgi:hypothetical protein
MIVGPALAGTAVSFAAIGYLAATDPKRRSAFRLPPVPRRHPRLAWTALLVPGLAVAGLAGGGGFLAWFGAVTVVGWAVAAVRPDGSGTLGLALADGLARLRDLSAEAVQRLRAIAARLVALRPALLARASTARDPDRVAALEARVSALEAELAALRGAAAAERADAVIVELPITARR